MVLKTQDDSEMLNGLQGKSSIDSNERELSFLLEIVG